MNPMNIAQAKYDLEILPARQALLRAMYREPHRTVEELAVIEREYNANGHRIKAARRTLSEAGVITTRRKP